jgi:two-component system, cell cycle sensor histidine kinase and response regulator CckA
VSQLDVRTLLIAIAALNILVAVTMYVFQKSQRVYPGFGLWTTAAAILALSYVLFFLRDLVPAAFTVVLASALASFGAIVRLDGLWRFLSSRRFTAWLLVVPLVILAVMSVLTYARNDPYGRTLVVGVGGFLIFGATSVVMVRSGWGKKRPAYLAAGVVFAGYAALVLGRGVYWFVQSSGFPLLDPVPVNVAFYVATMVFDVWLAFVLIAMNHWRTTQELLDEQEASEVARMDLAGLVTSLERSERRYRALFDLNRDGVLTSVRGGVIVDANDAACRMLGMTRRELMMAGRAGIVQPGPEVAQALEVRASRGEVAGVFTLIRKDGTTFPGEFSSMVLPNDDESEYAFVIFRDISDRLAAEQQLRESEARLLRAQKVAHAGSWEVDLATGSLWASEEAFRIYGLEADSPRETLEMTRLVPLPEEHPRLDKAFGDLVGGVNEYDLEFRIRRANDGALRVVHSIAELERDESGVPTRVVGVLHDVTETKETETALADSEERLRQSQKMEAVGQLAGGIAHDFNNLLTAIIGYSDLALADETARNGTLAGDIEQIRAAAQRASALTGQILAFSRRQTLRPTVVSLSDVFSGLEPLLRRTLGEDIELVLRETRDAAMVEIDTHQFEQVLLNLAVNARDAMPSGGRLTFVIEPVMLNEDTWQVYPEAGPGRYVLLSVSDTGVGMDPDTAAHVFEPFFTTKRPGQGTGLGLSTVYGIVRQSGGVIDVFSEPGKGTTFRVLLPRVESPGAANPAPETQTYPIFGKESILVVEDDDALRHLIARVLNRCGFDVVITADAEEALSHVSDQTRKLDLLLTDIVLPGGMRGDVLARRALELRPGLRVLHMSGYAQDAIVHEGRLDAGIDFVAKPFTPETLTTAIREVLDRRRSAAD